MYRLSDKESTHIIVNCSNPLAWLTLSNTSEAEVTEALVARAYAAVSCRNPLLRAVYKPEVEKFSLVVRDVSEIVRDEGEGKLPAHTTREFRTRDEAWAEYKRRIEERVWECSAMWEVIVCVLDRAASPDTDCVVFGYFNHGVADGAAVMEALGEFVRVLNSGLTTGTLPPHDFLGESLPVPKPFHERYPLFKFYDSTSDDEKEKLFAEVNAKLGTEGGRVRSEIVDKILTEEETQRFIAKCKGHGVSFTAGLFAAVAMATKAKKFDSGMPLNYRTKDNWGDLAVSFTDASLKLDLTSVWASNEGSDEDALWAALGKEFHKEIRKKLSSPEEKYRGMAVNYVRGALEEPDTRVDSMCTGPNNDEVSMCLSNVGIMDRYFADEGPLSVTEVSGYCSNTVSPTLVFWCYTFHGRFRLNILSASYTPKRKTLEAFSDKVFKYITKN